MAESTATVTTPDRTRELADRADVADVVHAAARAMDAKDWDLLTSLYTADAVGDYTAMTAVDRDAVIQSAKDLFGPLDASQHLVGNLEITVDGDLATVHSTVIAQHVRGDRQFLMGATYDDTLRRTDTGWRISLRRVRGSWGNGDMSVLGIRPVD